MVPYSDLDVYKSTKFSIFLPLSVRFGKSSSGLISWAQERELSKVNNTNDIIQIQNISKGNARKEKEDFDKNGHKNISEEVNQIKEKITKGLAINLVCDYCDGPVLGKPKVLKFADLERFFCCSSCKTGYNEKYKGRIESIKRRYEGKSEIEI